MPDLSNSQGDAEDIDEQEAEVNRTLFIRGIHENTTEDELFELFLQAGPLEKVAIPQNKNMAFITYKHSVSAPYAKELFCDTKLHGKMLNLSFRTGSIHAAGDQRQPRRDNYNSNREARNSSGGSYQSRHNPQQSNHSNYNLPGQQNELFASPRGSYISPAMQNAPFAANPQSMPHLPIQGYRSSADNREYVPHYVSFENPPENFMGAVPINHPNHQVGLEERRQRILQQQHYSTQPYMQNNQGRYAGHR